MILTITGHRVFKLQTYDIEWVKEAIYTVLYENKDMISLTFSGMASGVDLWFCEYCLDLNIPYIACVPFEEQKELMEDKEEYELREYLLTKAKDRYNVRNSYMVEHCTHGMCVWDGNKGGTHNVLQQCVEAKKDFFWINPVNESIWKCFK